MKDSLLSQVKKERPEMRDRLAAESAEEREARLQRMRINRLAAESVEERGDRWQRASD